MLAQGAASLALTLKVQRAQHAINVNPPREAQNPRASALVSYLTMAG